jgi:hypothetical protein
VSVIRNGSKLDMDALPKELLPELSGKFVGGYAAHLRGQRNRLQNLYDGQKRKADRLAGELAAARNACKRMAEELREISEAESAVNPPQPGSE